MTGRKIEKTSKRSFFGHFHSKKGIRAGIKEDKKIMLLLMKLSNLAFYGMAEIITWEGV